jgi:hypothetical protein
MSILQYLKEELCVESTSIDDITSMVARGEYPDAYFALSRDEQKAIIDNIKNSRNASTPEVKREVTKTHIEPFPVGRISATNAMQKYIDAYEKHGDTSEYFDDYTNNLYNKYKKALATQENLGEDSSTRATVYHGDNHGLDSINGNYRVMSLDGSNQENGPGIYFSTSKDTARGYGKHVVETTVDPKMFMQSREPIGKYMTIPKIAGMIKYINEHDEDFWYILSDYFEISEPSDVNQNHYLGLAKILSREQVRNFLITLDEKVNTQTFVEAFTKFNKYNGSYYDFDNERHYAILRNDDEPRPVGE